MSCDTENCKMDAMYWSAIFVFVVCYRLHIHYLTNLCQCLKLFKFSAITLKQKQIKSERELILHFPDTIPFRLWDSLEYNNF